MTDKSYYKIAEEEFESGNIMDELMLKARSVSGGDQEKSKWSYIDLRAKEIEENQNSKILHNGNKSNLIKFFFILLFFPITFPYYALKLFFKYDMGE